MKCSNIMNIYKIKYTHKYMCVVITFYNTIWFKKILNFIINKKIGFDIIVIRNSHEVHVIYVFVCGIIKITLKFGFECYTRELKS